ncbi:unnamed protein product, partial [Ectocarpus sp. 13 AM-2016]
MNANNYNPPLTRPTSPPVFAIGVVFSSLGGDVVKQADHFVSSATRLPFSLLFFFVFAVTMDGGRVDHVVRSREPSLPARGMIAPGCVKMVKHPRGSYTVRT